MRLPSLVQPAGADQDLYAYVGQEISRGSLPYLDAWDQKPPAIHYTYALLYSLWPHPSVVPAADLLAAVVIAFLLMRLERRMTGGPWIHGGDRLSRAGEPGLFAARRDVAARPVRDVHRAGDGRQPVVPARRHAHGRVPTRGERGRCAWLAGLLVGLAAAFKYNAAVYGLAALAAAAAWRHDGRAAKSAAG